VSAPSPSAVASLSAILGRAHTEATDQEALSLLADVCRSGSARCLLASWNNLLMDEVCVRTTRPLSPAMGKSGWRYERHKVTSLSLIQERGVFGTRLFSGQGCGKCGSMRGGRNIHRHMPARAMTDEKAPNRWAAGAKFWTNLWRAHSEVEKQRGQASNSSLATQDKCQRNCPGRC
jgi:hypothetical protein